MLSVTAVFVTVVVADKKKKGEKCWQKFKNMKNCSWTNEEGLKKKEKKKQKNEAVKSIYQNFQPIVMPIENKRL